VTSEGLLLDTCAILFITKNNGISPVTASRIDEASSSGNLYLSPISSWEIGRTVASRRLSIAGDPLRFFFDFLKRASAKLCDMGPDILVASSFLPGRIHKDPFDRILVETARKQDLTLVTSDRAILAYGAEGHVKTLAC
jgi:PIN domain nuclease of toxin-antitoxin system